VLLHDWRTALLVLVLVYGATLVLVQVLFSPARCAKRQRAATPSVEIDQMEAARVT
jgi:hypothetical protein